MFAVGDEIVCVDDSSGKPDKQWATPRYIKAGNHYVVREVVSYYWSGDGEYRASVFLSGVTRINGNHEVPFGVWRFRPVKRESIAIFRAMCVSTRPLVEV